MGGSRGSVRFFLTIPMVILAIAGFSYGQTSTGAITGRASDASGALIPGVEVSITSPAMIGGARTAPTDELGVYRFTLIPAGAYRVTFALPGFKTLNIDGVNVGAGATMTINGVMQVAATTEEVTVTSDAPAIDLEAANVGININSSNLDKLPYGKAIRGLSRMIPGIYTPYYDVGGNTVAGSTTVSGRTYGRTGQELMQFDGTVSNDTLFGDFGRMAKSNTPPPPRAPSRRMPAWRSASRSNPVAMNFTVLSTARIRTENFKATTLIKTSGPRVRPREQQIHALR